MVLLARTNISARQFWDPGAVETFIRQHLKCNPFYAMDSLCGEPGIEIVAASSMGFDEGRPQSHQVEIPKDLLDLLNGE